MKHSPKENYTKIPNELVRSPDLTSSEFRVLALILSLNPSYPSYQYMQNALKLARGTSRRAVQGLVDKQILSYVRGGSLRGANEYTLRPREDWGVGQNLNYPRSIIDHVPGQKLNSNKTKNKNNKEGLSSSLVTSNESIAGEVAAREMARDQDELERVANSSLSISIYGSAAAAREALAPIYLNTAKDSNQ